MNQEKKKNVVLTERKKKKTEVEWWLAPSQTVFVRSDFIKKAEIYIM